ncbi:hypothetical protein [Arthrobacter sp. NA-172]|uniref:hypothetical protein n=1 Tax=Arthrobacter sp. NA-172 TaxID=3367524 RepID=UPI0037541942
MSETIIRAIPGTIIQAHQLGERYFNVKGLTFQQQMDLRDELISQGCLVQEIFLLDPMQALVERRVRTELIAEQAKKEGKP